MSTHSGVRLKRQMQEVRGAGLVIQRMSIHQAGTILWQPFYSVNYVSGAKGSKRDSGVPSMDYTRQTGKHAVKS